MKRKINRLIQTGLGVVTIIFTTSCYNQSITSMKLVGDGVPKQQDLTVAVSSLSVTDPSYENIIVFCGPSGVGKSTLLNTIVEKNVSPSGVTMEESLTKVNQAYVQNGTKFIDLVALNKEHFKAQARDIAEIVKSKPTCKVIVIITLEAGRLRRGDLDLINEFLASMETPYYLLINKVTRQVMNMIEREGGLTSYLSLLAKQPRLTTMVEFDLTVNDEENACLSSGNNTTKLIEWIKIISSDLPQQLMPRSLMPYAVMFSDRLITFIGKHEGLKLETYKDIAGHPTIGYGHLITKNETIPSKITKEAADQLLAKDIQDRSAKFVVQYTKNLYQPEFDAVTSFVFNLGPTNFKNSTLLKCITAEHHRGNRAEKEEIWNQFCVWNKARIKGNLEPVKGLTDRRKREAYLFYYGDIDPSIYDFDWKKDYQFNG